MVGTEAALDRLEASLDALEATLDALAERIAAGERAEDNAAALVEEVESLRAEAERDADLRREAAEAVKSALADLRALMPREAHNG